MTCFYYHFLFSNLVNINSVALADLFCHHKIELRLDSPLPDNLDQWPRSWNNEKKNREVVENISTRHLTSLEVLFFVHFWLILVGTWSFFCWNCLLKVHKGQFGQFLVTCFCWSIVGWNLLCFLKVDILVVFLERFLGHLSHLTYPISESTHQ